MNKAEQFTVKIEFDKEKFQEVIEEVKANNPNVLEVIRCKDCEHSCESHSADYLLCAVWENSRGMAQVNPMGYCYEAKEKEGDA